MAKPDNPQPVLIKIIDYRTRKVWGRWLRMTSSPLILIGVGIVSQSPAMQWAGFVVCGIALLGALVHASQEKAMTIEEARQKLDSLESQP